MDVVALSVFTLFFLAALRWLTPRLRRWILVGKIPPARGQTFLGGHRKVMAEWTNNPTSRVGVFRGTRMARLDILPGHALSMVTLCHPDTVGEAIQKASSKTLFYAMMKKFLGDSVLITSGQRFKRNRKLVGGAFSKQCIRSMYTGVFRTLAEDLVARWSDLCNGRLSGERDRRKSGERPVSESGGASAVVTVHDVIPMFTLEVSEPAQGTKYFCFYG